MPAKNFTQIIIPKLTSSKYLLRLVIIAITLGLFLATFEVAMVYKYNQSIDIFWSRWYAHSFFITITNISIAFVLNFFRHVLLQLSYSKTRWMVIAIAVVVIWLTTILVNMFHHYTGFFEWNAKRILGELLLHSILCILVMMFIMHYLSLQFFSLKKNNADLENQVSVLEARFKPHFFFNALNTLLGLVETQPTKAANLIETMANYFKQSLRQPQIINLNEEIDVCNAFIKIENYRQDNQPIDIEWEYNVPKKIENEITIPSMLLQNLIEHISMKMSVHQHMESRIDIKISFEQGKIVITLNPRLTGTDNLSLNTVEFNDKLENTKLRLKQHFGDTADVVLMSISDSNQTIELSYPYILFS